MDSLASQLSRLPPKITIEFRHSWYSRYLQRFRIRKINQTGKYEAIQTVHSANILLAMTGPLAPALRSKILRLLLLHWSPFAIAEEVHCHRNIVYTMQENLFMYDSLFRPQFRSKDVLRKIFPAAEDSLITYLKQQSWVMQKEMMLFLWEKWDIHVHRFTIFWILKKRHWSEKREQRVDIRQNNELRLNWIADLLQLTAEQLVFVDETLFNETTEWRHQAYASVDKSARYQVSRKREHFWSVLSTYTINGYLLCTGIREGWFNDVSLACLLRCFEIINDMSLEIAKAIDFDSSACSVCFDSSIYNGSSSGVSLDFASSVCFGFARRFLRWWDAWGDEWIL